MPSDAKDSPEGIRSSNRKRVPSARILEAEAEFKKIPRRKKPEMNQGDLTPEGPTGLTTSTPKMMPQTSPKSTSPKTSLAKNKGPKLSFKKVKQEGDAKLESKEPELLSPYILVILVHVDRQGNPTEFWTAPKSKISNEQLQKLAACHHGALNDDEDLFREIFAMLVRNFEQLDEIFFEKPETRPVQINRFVSEVYQMHFGDFGAGDTGEQPKGSSF